MQKVRIHIQRLTSAALTCFRRAPAVHLFLPPLRLRVIFHRNFLHRRPPLFAHFSSVTFVSSPVSSLSRNTEYTTFAEVSWWALLAFLRLAEVRSFSATKFRDIIGGLIDRSFIRLYQSQLHPLNGRATVVEWFAATVGLWLVAQLWVRGRALSRFFKLRCPPQNCDFSFYFCIVPSFSLLFCVLYRPSCIGLPVFLLINWLPVTLRTRSLIGHCLTRD